MHCKLAIVFIVSLLLQGCLFVDIPLSIPPWDYNVVEVSKGKSTQSILLLDVDGEISSGVGEDTGFFGITSSTVNDIAEKLHKAREDRSVKAVILRVDSPGGGVTASDIIYRLLKDYREETGVPVYVSMLDLAASGGYYIAMAADEIYAHPTTVTGSIGVIAMFPEAKELGDRIGVHAQVIKSGAFKDIGGFWKKMPAEERAMLQAVVDSMYDRFVDVIVEGRPNLTRDEILGLADGRIYTAQQAEEAGLVDGIMYLDELAEKVKQDVGAPKARVIMYRKTTEDSVNSYYATARANPAAPRAAAGPAQLNLVNIDMLRASRGPAFHYLWVP